VTDVKQYIRDRVVEVTESGCWIWMQTLNRGGYGMVLKRGMGQRTAHRLSYATFVGPIPEGMYICHRCDVRCCVNPDHLFVGTHTDNVRDAVRKKRMYNQRLTHCPRGHEYTPENTLLRKGNNARRCHTCRKVQDAANAARRLRRQKAVLGNWCNSKLNEEQVRYVLASQEPVSHLAYRIGISIDAVWRIKTGRSWKHIYRAAVAAETKVDERVSDAYTLPRVTDEMVRAAHRVMLNGDTLIGTETVRAMLTAALDGPRDQ
jgi:hypothetical protein